MKRVCKPLLQPLAAPLTTCYKSVTSRRALDTLSLILGIGWHIT